MGVVFDVWGKDKTKMKARHGGVLSFL